MFRDVKLAIQKNESGVVIAVAVVQSTGETRKYLVLEELYRPNRLDTGFPVGQVVDVPAYNLMDENWVDRLSWEWLRRFVRWVICLGMLYRPIVLQDEPDKSITVRFSHMAWPYDEGLEWFRGQIIENNGCGRPWDAGNGFQAHFYSLYTGTTLPKRITRPEQRKN